MKKPRIILHIGSHKTGTTGIQRFCSSNRIQLASQGIYYPSYDLVGVKTHYAHHALAHGLAGMNPDWPAEKVREFLHAAARDCPEGGTILISAEPFIRHTLFKPESHTPHLSDRDYWNAKSRYIQSVAEVFQDFEVEIVAVFRRQTDYFNSLYQEVVKVTRFSGSPFEFYLMKRHEFNYFAQIKSWSESFPNIRVLVFEELLKQGNLIHDFMNTVAGRALELPEVSMVANVSLHPLIVETKRRFNARLSAAYVDKPSGEMIRALERLQKHAFSQKWITEIRRHSYLTPSERRFLSLSCRTSNQKLRSRYFPEGSRELEGYSAEPAQLDARDPQYVKIINRLLTRFEKKV